MRIIQDLKNCVGTEFEMMPRFILRFNKNHIGMENSSFAFHRNVSHPIEEQDALINDTEWSGNGHQFFSEDSIVPRNNNSKESGLPISPISLHDPTFSLNIPFFLLFAFSAALFMVNRRYPILQWARHILSSISPRRDNGQFEMVPLKVSAHQKRRDEVSLLIPRLYPKQSDGLSETEQMEDEVDDLAGKVSKLSKLLSKEAALNVSDVILGLLVAIGSFAS